MRPPNLQTCEDVHLHLHLQVEQFWHLSLTYTLHSWPCFILNIGENPSPQNTTRRPQGFFSAHFPWKALNSGLHRVHQPSLQFRLLRPRPWKTREKNGLSISLFGTGSNNPLNPKVGLQKVSKSTLQLLSEPGFVRSSQAFVWTMISHRCFSVHWWKSGIPPAVGKTPSVVCDIWYEICVSYGRYVIYM